MTVEEHRRVIDELQNVIDETRHTLERFEATGMDERLPEDFHRLHDIYSRAVNDQRAYTLQMLDLGVSSHQNANRCVNELGRQDEQ